MKHVIHIFGACGSGTSSIGRYITEQAGYTFMDTDDYFWIPTDPKYTTKRDKNERIRMMQTDIDASDNVVISGSLTEWGDVLIPQFTLAVRVITAQDIRKKRLQEREFIKFGVRIRPGGDMYEAHLQFMDWAMKYDSGGPDMRSSVKHDEWQKILKCPLIVVDGSKPFHDTYQIIMKGAGL